jgi:PAS domain S-box-containing protein
MIDARCDAQVEIARLLRESEVQREKVYSSEARYRSLVDATASVVWRAAPDGSLLEAPGGSTFAGRDDQALCGWNWIDFVHPDDREIVLDLWNRSISEGKPLRSEHRLLTPSGEYRWVCVRGVPVFDSGLVLLEWVGTVIDIHDERNKTNALVESRWRLTEELAAARRIQLISTALVHADDEQGLFDQILDAAVAVMHSDFASIQIVAPPALAGEPERLQLLGNRGFTPEAAAHWKWVTGECPTSCGEALVQQERCIIPDVEKVDYPESSRELEYFRACGIRSCQTTPLVTRAGKLVGMVSTHWRWPHVPSAAELGRFDVLARLAADFIEYRRSTTEREQLLAMTEHARQEAESANKAKDEFLAVLSHELRSPMNAMLGWLHILKTAGKHDPDIVARAADTIERNIQVQAQVINDLLDVSRIMSGKLQLEQERVDVGAVLMSSAESLRPSAEGKKVALRLFVEREADTIGDAARLQQVVVNLLGNAIKFTPASGVVTATVDVVDSEIRLVVEDTGPGIAPEFLPHLFERFRQADSSTTRRHGGLGLGLAIVKNVVELHGGRVGAESEGAGRGARFTVTLPRAERRMPKSVVHNGHRAPVRSTNGLASVDVLVVDDDADSRAALELAFEESGAQVRTAASVRQALDAYTAHPPDILISDVGMPGEDGYVLIRAIREREEGRGRHTFAIAVTGFAARQDRETALRAGFDEHVAKPVDPGVLFECVRVLEASRANGLSARL